MKLDKATRNQILNDGKIPGSLKTHNLQRLVSTTGYTLTEMDKELLSRLERAAVWYGRYPIPKCFRGRSETTLPNGRQIFTSWVGRNDVQLIEQFLDRFREHVGCPTTFRRPDLVDAGG